MMTLRPAIAVLLVLFAGPLRGQVPLHASRQQDVYAIYSLLMPGAVLANLGPDHNQRWAIADTTINIDDMNPKLSPDAALRPPADNPRPFQEALADFHARKYQRLTLGRHFHLDRPYTLLSAAEISEMKQTLGTAAASSALQQKYAGYPGITFFSDVYFDSRQRAALVYQLDWCGNLCSQGEWIYLEKHNGHWVQRSGQAAVVSGARPFE
ncbi:MAG: hypothetical protein QJR10_00400 [Bacillota bacterium]|nr:hypothetical protein [Bacillota bacterium]